jgi:hypothetical protein
MKTKIIRTPREKTLDADEKPGFAEDFNKNAPKYFKAAIRKNAAGNAK